MTPSNVPFAFAVDKSEFIFAIRPTLAAALSDLRERFPQPFFLVGMTAFFPDGRSEVIPFQRLVIKTEGREQWISDEQAGTLQAELYPLSSDS